MEVSSTVEVTAEINGQIRSYETRSGHLIARAWLAIPGKAKPDGHVPTPAGLHLTCWNDVARQIRDLPEGTRVTAIGKFICDSYTRPDGKEISRPSLEVRTLTVHEPAAANDFGGY